MAEGDGNQDGGGVAPAARTLLGDVRAGTVQFFVGLALVAAGGVIIAITGVQIPLWALGLSVLVGGIALAFIAYSYEQRLVAKDAVVDSLATTSRQLVRERDDAKALVVQAGQSTSFPVTAEAQAIVRRVRALQGNLEEWGHTYATAAQTEAYRAIVAECMDIWPSSPTIGAAAARGEKDDPYSSELQTMLGQIDAHAMGAGSGTTRT